MAPLPVEVLLGLYLGLLTGIIPAFVAGALGFLVKYVTGVTLPGFGVVVLALAIASVNGGLLALTDPAIIQAPRLLVATLIVLMLSLYAHSQGDKLGAELPRRVSLKRLRQRTLSADVVEFVGGIGQVTVRPTGDVRNMEGYPALPADLRTTIREGSWRLPADLPLSELEIRLEERLRTDHDLADVAVSIDEQGRATIAAAPPSSGLSRRVPDGHRAVSISALVPTGVARGDEVTVVTPDGRVDGTVLSARTDGDAAAAATEATSTPEVTADGGEAAAPEPAGPTMDATTGGEGRLTVAVPRREAAGLLSVDRGRVVVRSRGTSHEFEALSLLKRAGRRIGKATVAAGALGDDYGVDDAEREFDVTVIALRHVSGEDGRHADWTVVPDDDASLAAGDDLFVLGTKPNVDRFAEAAAR